MELNLNDGDYGLEKEELDALRFGKSGFRPAGCAVLGLRECRRIKSERAASQAWNARPDAESQRFAMNCAIAALEMCERITYFETDNA